MSPRAWYRALTGPAATLVAMALLAMAASASGAQEAQEAQEAQASGAVEGAQASFAQASFAQASFAQASGEEQNAPLAGLPAEGFDHYTLALTWHPGFCASRSRPPRECREPALREGADRGFVLHGLWPSLPERFADRGVDRRRWWRDGCFLETPRPDGGFCRAHPPLSLPAGLSRRLEAAMPGRASCLDRYQYAKHAACLALPEAAYFSASVALVEAVNESAFGAFVTLNQGGEVARNALIDAFEAAFGEQTGRSLRLSCGGRGNRLLTEVRIGIAADRLASFPAAESLVRQPRGRCATRVRIARFE